MNSLLILVPIALILTFVGIIAFIWAVRNGQYDDLERSGRDLLFDDTSKGDKLTPPPSRDKTSTPN